MTQPIQVESRGRFVAKPRLAITFHGCEVIDHHDIDYADVDRVVQPIAPSTHTLMYQSFRQMEGFQHRDYPVTWGASGEDVEVILTPESLRPDSPWTTDQDDYTIAARDNRAEHVTVTWALTEEGNDAVTRGEFQAPTAKVVSAVELYKQAFQPGD